MHELRDAPHRAWIDTPLPVPGGKLPRQASRSRWGRQRLCSLLKYMEHSELRAGPTARRPPYDVGRLRETPGVAERR